MLANQKTGKKTHFEDKSSFCHHNKCKLVDFSHDLITDLQSAIFQCHVVPTTRVFGEPSKRDPLPNVSNTQIENFFLLAQFYSEVELDSFNLVFIANLWLTIMS